MSEPIPTEASTIKERFTQLDSKRKQHLERARLCSALTIPSLLPAEGKTENDDLPTPYQGLGAQAVNNLASKLLMTLFPANSPFFRLSVDSAVLEELKRKLDAEGLKTQVEDRLVAMERLVTEFVEESALRVPAFRALRLLVVTGDVLLFLADDGRMKVFRLDQYVAHRDPMGNLIEAVVRERVAIKALDQRVQDAITDKVKEDQKDGTIDIYTHILRDGEVYAVDQEVAGQSISTILREVKGRYKTNELPWFALRWTFSDGDNYGRGLVDEYLGDFISLESLSKSVVEGAAAAAKVIFMVRPGGMTVVEDLVSTANAGFCSGNPEDVQPLQVNKLQDFSTASQAAGTLSERIAKAFLLHSSVQREAERVTAEEVRYMAQELEDALGGIYSVLSIEFQLPLVRRILTLLARKKKLPKLPEAAVKPVITTGFEALGRGHDLRKLLTFKSILDGLEGGMQYINVSDYLSRAAQGIGLDVAGLVKTQEQVAEERQQAAMMQMGQQVVPSVATEMAKGAMQAAPSQQG